MPNKTVNKNTPAVYDFYVNRMTNPKSLKNKNICLLALGNAPKDFTDTIIVFENGKFEKAPLKCGEAIKQTSRPPDLARIEPR